MNNDNHQTDIPMFGMNMNMNGQMQPGVPQPNQIGSQQPHQQQQPQQNPRMGSLPMLTPELLASLTPQQMQAMKNNPQFQEMMRQYIQRQQLLNQQSKGFPTSGAPIFPQVQNMPIQQQVQPQSQQSPMMAQGNNPMASNGRHRIPQQGPAAFQQGPRPTQLDNFAGLQQQHLQSRLGPQQQQQQPPGIEGNFPSSIPNSIPQQGPNFQGSGIPGGGIPGTNVPIIGPGGPPSATAIDAHIMNNVVGNAMPMSEPNGVVPFPNAQQSPNMLPPNAMNHTPSQTNLHKPGSIIDPSRISSAASIPGVSQAKAQELQGRLQIKQLTNLHQWSDKFEKEGAPVPLDTDVYEEIIHRDFDYLANLAKQHVTMKHEVESASRDLQQYNQIKQLRMNSIQLSAKNQMNNSIWGEGYQGYGNGITNTASRLLLPERDISDRMINERLAQTKGAKNYVPIRLEFDQDRDKFKLRDTFLWDLNEKVFTVEDFTSQLLDDYKLIPRIHYQTILNSIKEQIAEYQQKPAKTTGEIRIPIKIDIIMNNTQLTDQFEWDILNTNENEPEEFATIMCDELYLPGEFSTTIAHSIREQCQMYIRALNLVGCNYDGTPVTEDSIRNHLLPSLRLVSKDFQVVDDFFSILRNPTNVPDFSPQLIKLTELELERMDKEMERESRRKRRHNYNEDGQVFSVIGGGSGGFGSGTFTPTGNEGFIKTAPSTGSSRGFSSSRRNAAHIGRGNVIPDLSDVPKTFRTPAPSSILPGAIDLAVPEVYEYDEIFVNRTQVKNPDYRPPTPEPVLSDRVKYEHDPLRGTFNVTIKCRLE
ncbi:Snf5 protein [Candida orthopsilosis Co 90-125]|uniref:Snf5 protein n=1 Tax=Candida orthopsilosis (strain 90-125) TaxID=1136231 RepID=H8X3R7_CANO9|nr:Snf5 protein [Candida orthopsilosis Co 90-125]CCG25705.1 Snf5 protein [Candida orthopsilosis Co 90-125]